jgi:hypothetical protein
MEELYSTEGDYGLRTLSEPDKAVVEYVARSRLDAAHEVHKPHNLLASPSFMD